MLALRRAAERLAGEGRAAFAAQGLFSAAAAAAAAQEPLMLVAEPRGSAGSIAATKLRRGGKTPGIVFSGPPGEEQQLLAFDSKDLARLVHKLGRTGWACSVFELRIAGQDGGGRTVRALGRQVHLTADTDVIENVTFIHCPPEREVRVDVPLKVIGDEVSPGIKAGGSINWIRRTIPCTARGDAIPHDFTIDISKMGLNDKLHYTDLSIPPGARLHSRVDPALPILKVAK